MYQRKINFNDIISSLSANHKVFSKNAVKRAYTYAEKKHEGQFRKTGESYIMHPLRVAKFIAEWGFDSEMVIAALLHDVVEDCNTSIEEIMNEFGSPVANMVNTLTAVNKELHKAKGLSKQEIDKMSDAHLLRTMSEKAMFIKIADRLDNLNTIEGVSEEKQIGKAQHTREILIPMVKKEGAYYLVDQLEELCFKIEHKERYNEISSRYYELRLSNAITTGKIQALLSELFSGNSHLLPKELLSYQSNILDFTCTPRTKVSIFRQLSQEADNLKLELPQLFTKHKIALYDFTLILDNSISNPLDVFYKYYEAVLSDRDIYILDYKKTSYEDSKYLLLCDEMDNLYRFFLRTESEQMHYKLGNIIDTDSSLSFVDVDDVDPRDAYKNKIKVFKKDGSACYIDAEATVLDFAFAIHSDLGLHFHYAIIDNLKTGLPAHTRLNEGDMIEIVPNPKIKPKIQWFNCVKTSRATHYLVKYFSQNFDM